MRHPDELVLWYDKRGRCPANLIGLLDGRLGMPIKIFLDDCGKYVDEVRLIQDRYPLQRALLVLSGRSNIVHRSPVFRKIPVRIRSKVTTISHDDVDPLLQKLERCGPWDRLSRLNIEERRAEIYDRAGKQLLVGLRKATSGQGYDLIILGECKRVPPRYPKTAYNDVRVAPMHRSGVSRTTFLEAMDMLGYSYRRAQSPEKLTERLEDIVTMRNDGLLGRHHYISEYIAKRVVTEGRVLTIVRALLNALSRFGSPVRIHARGGEARRFAALTNHDFLRRRFRARRSEVLQMMEELSQTHRSDALSWLQMARYEQGLGGRYTGRAVNHIRTALQLWPESFHIVPAYANIHVDAAVGASDADSAFAIMEVGTGQLEEQCANPDQEAYGLVGLARGRMAVLLKWWPEKAREEWQALRRRLQEARSRHAGNPEIDKVLRDVPLMIARYDARRRA